MMATSFTSLRIMVAFQRDLTLLLGDDLWKDLEPEFARINSLRKEMV